MAREKELWGWLSKARLALKDRLHMHRVENSASPGMPDVEAGLNLKHLIEGAPDVAIQVWFELKSAARPARAATAVRFKMRDKQVEWARRRWAIGGHVYWLLQVGDGRSRRVYMLRGPEGPWITKGLTEAQLAERCVFASNFESPDPGSIIIAASARA